MESEQATPVDSIKDIVQSSVKIPKFDKHLNILQRTYQPKRWGNNNKDEDNSLKTLNDKNQSWHFYVLVRLKYLTLIQKEKTGGRDFNQYLKG